MQWADEIRIETPEQIDVQLEVAGLGSRFVAQLIDWLFKWGILLGVSLLVLVLLTVLEVPLLGGGVHVALLALLVALYYAFLLGFDIYFEVRHNGQTPGKRVAGIRVVREGGGPVDFQAACVRNLLGMADFLPLFYMLGSVLILLNRRGQRLGDLAAGTIVLRERSLAAPREVKDEVAELASEEFVFTAEQLAACSGGDREVLRSFFERRPQLEHSAREQLAVRLAATFCAKTACTASTVDDGETAEIFLACLYRDLDNWKRHGG
jgi:uncharacterized RDD family membrane protein YckC